MRGLLFWLRRDLRGPAAAGRPLRSMSPGVGLRPPPPPLLTRKGLPAAAGLGLRQAAGACDPARGVHIAAMPVLRCCRPARGRERGMGGRVDVAIIGGGPAGLTAATYLRRFLRSVVVLDAGPSRARYIPESHNCPGFPQGVSGDELLARMREQAEGFGATIVRARADGLEHGPDGFVVAAEGGDWQAEKVILATG